MWTYTKTDELYHYGVLGMKWGVRRSSPKVQASRKNYKQVKKEYNKAFNKAYNYSGYHPISQYTNKKKRAESNKRWNEVSEKREALNEARKNYKQAKGKNTKNNVAKAANAYIKRRNKKQEARLEDIHNRTDKWGVGISAANEVVKRTYKRRSKALAVDLLNATANQFIKNSNANYATKRGVDFVRRAGIKGLSISAYADDIRMFRNIGESYVHAIDNRSKKK